MAEHGIRIAGAAVRFRLGPQISYVGLWTSGCIAKIGIPYLFRNLFNMNAQKNFLDDLKYNVYCRLRPSKRNGVGVFAIRDIPKGANPFRGVRQYRWESIDLKTFEKDKSISKEIKELAQALYSVDRGKLWFPNHSLNAVDISYFLNHSKNPNVETKDGKIFRTKKRIKRGDELLVDYQTYTSEADSYLSK